MIPETVGALLAFLGLIAPGLIYQLRRETRRASITETAFREASRVALVSLGLTTAALAAVAIVRAVEPAWIADPGVWLRQGNEYFVAHYRLVLRTAIIVVGLACSLALLADWIVRT